MKVKFVVGQLGFFGSSGYSYDLDLVAERDGTQLQCDFIRRTFQDASGVIVDAGAGRCRISAPLTHCGLNIIAVDLNEEELRIGKFRSEKILFSVADIASLPLPDGCVEGIFSIYTSLGYDDNCIINELSELRRIANDKSLLVLDLLNGLYPTSRFGWERTKNGFGFFFRIRRRSRMRQINMAIAIKELSVFTLSYPAFGFSLAAQILEFCGWRIRSVFGNFEREPFNGDHPRMIFVCSGT